MSKEKPTTKLCKYCKSEIPYEAKICPHCRKKQKGGILKWIIVLIVVMALLSTCFGSNGDNSTNTSTTTSSNTQSSEKEENKTISTEKETKAEQDKYYVGDTWQNKTIKVTYTKCYEFTDFNSFNAPADGNIVICAEFEFENISKSDTSVSYVDFHGYADGYEVNQSYAPDGTGLDFSVKMSAGRKGTGIVAFEVPKDATEIEIEFSPNLFTSENIIFVYE